MAELNLKYKEVRLPSGKTIIIIEKENFDEFLKKIPTKKETKKKKEQPQNPFDFINNIMQEAGFNILTLETKTKSPKKIQK